MTDQPKQILSLDDPRISPFVDVTSKDKRESTEYFIAEGENVALRLLASEYRCERVLCVDRKADRIRPHLQPGTELLLAPEKLLHEIVGFKFHSGVMGMGLRKLVPTLAEITLPPSPFLLLVLPEITDSANLGAILRVAAGFGVAGVLLGERCRDPFTRQTVRTSMGTIFSLQLIHSADIAADLDRLKEAKVQLVATVLDSDAVPLPELPPVERRAVLMGNEGPGLERVIVDRCDVRTTIPMQLGTDSLNVVVATGIFLYQLTTRPEPRM